MSLWTFLLGWTVLAVGAVAIFRLILGPKESQEQLRGVVLDEASIERGPQARRARVEALRAAAESGILTIPPPDTTIFCMVCGFPVERSEYDEYSGDSWGWCGDCRAWTCVEPEGTKTGGWTNRDEVPPCP